MRFWSSISLVALLMATAVLAQAPASVPSKPPAANRKVNELTLAALRPGRDFAARAVQLYRKPDVENSTDATQLGWSDVCRKETLTLDTDAEKRIQVIRTAGMGQFVGGCEKIPARPWKTGRGLRVNDPAPRVVQLYGEPDSRSPSTKDGRKLELLYYAFDWAGADVPQVMEVLCTVEDDGKTGRVVEITLAAPSL